MSGWSLALSKNRGRRDVGSKINQEIALECFHVTSCSHVGVPEQRNAGHVGVPK